MKGPDMQKSILITGCSSGIGLDCAKTLHAMGWLVFASCRKQKDCDRIVQMGIHAPRLDYADAQSITKTLAYITNKTDGTLDAVFNNGAFAVPGAVQSVSENQPTQSAPVHTQRVYGPRCAPSSALLPTARGVV